MGQREKKDKQVVVVQKYNYSTEFKHHVCREFMAGKGGMKELCIKYGIPSHSSLFHWLERYGYRENKSDIRVQYDTIEIGLENFGIAKSPPLPMNQLADNIEDNSSEEVKRLKKELEEAKLKAEAYLRVIEIAEQELKLPIRKKSNTK
ncbi:MAG: hypothetical protein U0U66_14905 [Cytophagaceae bacterium]